MNKRAVAKQLLKLATKLVEAETHTMDWLEQNKPKAYDALPETYKADSGALQFFEEDGQLYAEHDQKGVPIALWDGQSWTDTPRKGRGHS